MMFLTEKAYVFKSTFTSGLQEFYLGCKYDMKAMQFFENTCTPEHPSIHKKIQSHNTNQQDLYFKKHQQTHYPQDLSTHKTHLQETENTKWYRIANHIKFPAISSSDPQSCEAIDLEAQAIRPLPPKVPLGITAVGNFIAKLCPIGVFWLAASKKGPGGL